MASALSGGALPGRVLALGALVLGLLACGTREPGPVATGTAAVVKVVRYQLRVQPRQADGTLGAEAAYDLKGVCWSPFGKGESQDNTGRSFALHAGQDIPLMQAANINTVKTYGALSLTLDASGRAQGLAVLDQLHAAGIMVAMTVFGGYDDDYAAAVKAFKDHPAVLLWVVGNELNYNKLYSSHTLDESISRVEAVAEDIKRLDPNHPVAVGFGELPSTDVLARVLAADLWAINVYPGIDFGKRFTDWRARSNKPFFVSEYGVDAYNKTLNGGAGAEDQASQATGVRQLTAQLRGHLSARDPEDVCIGGSVFEWNDEWWKSGNPAAHDTGGASFPGAYPDGHATEEWWGLVDADRGPRAAYDALRTLYAP